MTNRIKIIWFLALVIFSTCFQTCCFSCARIDFNSAGCYTGASISWETVDDGQEYQVTTKDVAAYDEMAQKRPAFVMQFMAFKYGADDYMIEFPKDWCNVAYKNASIPIVSWEPRNWDPTNPEYAQVSILPEILNGKYDEYIKRWAKDIKSFGKLIIIRFAHEMNNKSYPWNGYFNGASVKEGFGDQEKYDGPEIYVAAYRHVFDIFKRTGVTNVLWFWCPWFEDYPKELWNVYYLYYPGNDCVDIVGADGYNWGTTQSWSRWMSFSSIFGNIYKELNDRYPNKPFMIGEFASAENGGDKAEWIKDAFYQIKNNFPKIKAFIWFQHNDTGAIVNNLTEHSDWRINSSDKALDAFRTAMKDNYFRANTSMVSSDAGSTPQD